MRVQGPGIGLVQGGRRVQQHVAACALGCFLLTLPAALGSAPAVNPEKTPSKHSAAAAASPPPAASPGKPEMAVVYDDTYHPPAKDLLLTLEDERKAEADAHYINGLMLEETSDADAAMAEYLKALALDPANIDLSIKIAWQYLRRGDTPGAINLLKDTIKAAPKQARPCLALANIYFNNLNKVDLAQKFSQQALDLDPASISAYEYLRDIYRTTEQSAKIPALLDRASKAESKDAMFWLRLGAMYAEVFLADDATHNTSDLKKTTAIFQKALSYGNNDVDTIGKIADFFVVTQQLAEAVPLYQRMIDIDPSLNAARENLARCYEGLQQPEKAAAALEDLIKVNPVQPRAYETLAKIYEDLGQMEKAANNYEQSLLISPNDAPTYERLSLELLKLNKPERAVGVLTEARKHFPDIAGFSFLLAVSFEEAKQHQQALAMFEQTEVEARGTNNSNLLDSRFYFNYGVSAEQSGLYEKAATLLKRALETEDDPRQIANDSNYLGYMWVDHNQNVEEGGDLIKKAVELMPNSGEYLDSLGWYYYKTNRPTEALAQLALAVEKIEKPDPIVYEHMGDTYLKLNDAAKAIGCWQKALELDPANAEVPALNKRITDAKAAPVPSPSPAPSPTPGPKS